MKILCLNDKESSSCIICHTLITESNNLIQCCICMSVYHGNCLQQWLVTKRWENKCPSCGENIKVEPNWILPSLQPLPVYRSPPSSQDMDVVIERIASIISFLVAKKLGQKPLAASLQEKLVVFFRNQLRTKNSPAASAFFKELNRYINSPIRLLEEDFRKYSQQAEEAIDFFLKELKRVAEENKRVPGSEEIIRLLNGKEYAEALSIWFSINNDWLRKFEDQMGSSQNTNFQISDLFPLLLSEVQPRQDYDRRLAREQPLLLRQIQNDRREARIRGIQGRIFREVKEQLLWFLFILAVALAVGYIKKT